MKCTYIKPGGEKCRCNTFNGSKFCWRHSPEITMEEKLEASQKGGRNKTSRLIINLPDLKIQNAHDLPPFLIDTIRSVRGGLIDTRIGSVVGYLSSILLRSYEISNLEERIERLEQTMTLAYVETANPFAGESNNEQV